MANSFSSKIGILLAAAGSAVGLGSIWKFPYVVGENGGGAFIILYIVTLIQIITNTLCILSLTGAVSGLTIMGQNLFDAANNFTTNVLIPFGAMGIAVIAGWFVPKRQDSEPNIIARIHLFTLRWVIPVIIIIIFLKSINVI